MKGEKDMYISTIQIRKQNKKYKIALWICAAMAVANMVLTINLITNMREKQLRKEYDKGFNACIEENNLYERYE